MITAPMTAYTPVYVPMMPAQAQQQAVNTNYQPQQQMQGGFYNYPTTSCFTNPATAKSQYNGVNIEIINPTGSSAAPNTTNSVASAPYYTPISTPVMMPPVYPTAPSSQVVVNPPQSQPVAAQPAEIPAPVIQQAPAAAPVVVPTVQAETPTVQEATPAPATPVVAPAVAENAAELAANFAGKLNTNDLDAQKVAIETLAETIKNNSAEGKNLLDTQVFDALVSIINKDTTTLEGPTPEVLELRQKPQEQLSEADKIKAGTPSPLEKAEINKQYALYTIAYMQELLNNELQTLNGSALELKDLPCIENVIETAKSNPNPMLRIAALASLSHIARPEYKADLTTIFELAKADEDTRVQDHATKAIAALNA